MNENDNALVILRKLIEEKTLAPKNITPTMRRLCVEYMRKHKKEYTQEQIASLFKVSFQTIRNDVMAIRKRYAEALTSLDARNVVGALMESAIHLKEWAILKGDYRLAWDIENDLIDKLMDLGFLKKAPLELAIKTKKAEDELTQEEAAVIDSVLLQVKERRNKERLRKLGFIEDTNIKKDGEIVDNGNNGIAGGDAGSINA